MMAAWNWRRAGKRSWILMIVLLVGLLAGWFLGGLPGTDEMATNRGHSWSLPPVSLLDRYSADTFQSIKSSPVWPTGAAASSGPNGNKAQQTSEWTLVGVVLDTEKYALVMDDSKVIRVIQGDSMPGGGVLKKVTDVGITIAKNGCSQKFKLFTPKNNAPANPCKTISDNNTAGNSGETHE